MFSLIGEPDSLQRFIFVGAVVGIAGGLGISLFGWEYVWVCAVGGAITGVVAGFKPRIRID